MKRSKTANLIVAVQLIIFSAPIDVSGEQNPLDIECSCGCGSLQSYCGLLGVSKMTLYCKIYT